jgi:hypothetical protein
MCASPLNDKFPSAVQHRHTYGFTMGSSPTNAEPEAFGASNSENMSADELELRAQGHIGELPRQFGVLSTLSLAFTITNSWIAYSAVFAIPLIAGGATCVVWSLVVGFVVCSIITLGLAELASAYPTSGGQYQYEPHDGD